MPDLPAFPPGISDSNRRLLLANDRRRELLKVDFQQIFWWRRPCNVKVLLVTDGGLDFGVGDFGMSTLVDILISDAPANVRFRPTLAHLRSDVTNAQVMQGAAGVVRSIKGFCFDDPTHFDPTMYDEVWLFGIETFFHQANYARRVADPARYPQQRLGDGELRALSAHMNRGGGVFATGDHGALGRGLCGSVNRVRSMRWWNSFSSTPGGPDEVSMTGPRRNDSNQVGHDAGSQFSDQSDDIPQPLDLRLYSTPVGALRRARYPHPVLCGTDGRIDVFPDHPHEGECRVPASLTDIYAFDGSAEYPQVPGAAAPTAPEIVAWGRVPAGNDARGSKDATQAHRFAVVSTYDGQRVNVGRVVCDSTWHHFINVNLIGVVERGGFDEFGFAGESATKHDGFLSTASGRAVLDKIKNYFTNIGVWLAPPPLQRCFNSRMWWELVYADRIMEAALVDPEVKFEAIPADVFSSIGIHARDAFGRRASQCQTLSWVLDWLHTTPLKELIPHIDPWQPQPEFAEEKARPQLAAIDPMPSIDTMIGAALVALRRAMPYPPEKIGEEHDKLAFEALAKGSKHGAELAVKEYRSQMALFSKALQIG